MSLETMLEMDLLDADLAEQVKTALESRFYCSQWPAVLEPLDLAQHMARPSRRRLCAKLFRINDSYQRTESVYKAFELIYPDKDENYCRDKLTEAFTRAYRAATRLPRHLFLPSFAECWNDEDVALGIPLGCGQTISQPSLVQLMTALVDPRSSDRVLEIGTGSGYQAAILACLTKEVYTIEVYKPLSRRAMRTCGSLDLRNMVFHEGDGSEGWPAEAPFDIIIASARAPAIPQSLLDQLNPKGGRLLIPIQKEGKEYAELTLVVRRGERYDRASLIPTFWVPIVGAAGYGFETPQSRQPFIDFSPPPMKRIAPSQPNTTQLSAI
jgi:protein-L-isoaspartate(D-aspartate) O-methyltransferase